MASSATIHRALAGLEAGVRDSGRACCAESLARTLARWLAAHDRPVA